MDPQELRAIQAPIKERYKDAPQAAMITLKAEGRLGEGITCKVQTGQALVAAGLHPATGGDGLSACSGDMLLEALVACAGVTLGAVATSIGIDVRSGVVRAEGDLDFREPGRREGRTGRLFAHSAQRSIWIRMRPKNSEAR